MSFFKSLTNKYKNNSNEVSNTNTSNNNNQIRTSTNLVNSPQQNRNNSNNNNVRKSNQYDNIRQSDEIFSSNSLMKESDIIDNDDSIYVLETWGDYKRNNSYLCIDFTKLCPGERVLSLNVGAAHIAMVTVSGKIYTWGDGQYGRLGHGDEESIVIPKQVQAFKNKQIFKVCCGGRSTVALSADGELYTWGNNEFGQLGKETSDEFTAIPQRIVVQGARRLVGLDAGASRAAVIDSSGALYTWGRGDHGRLGHGDTDNRNVPTLVQCLYGHVVVSVALGGGHSLALTKAGDLFSWGRGENGQLGHGTYQSQQLTPKQVHFFIGMPKIIDIAAGGYHSIAHLDDGTVYSWGMSEYGILGTGDSEDGASNIPQRILVPRGVRFKYISSGFQHTVALSTDGHVYGWGCGLGGRLGTFNEKNQYAPFLCSTPNYQPLVISAGEISTIVVGKRIERVSTETSTTTTMTATLDRLPIDNEKLQDDKESDKVKVNTNILNVDSPLKSASGYTQVESINNEKSENNNNTDKINNNSTGIDFVNWLVTISRIKQLLSLVQMKRSVPTQMKINNSLSKSTNNQVFGQQQLVSPVDSLFKELDEVTNEIKSLSSQEKQEVEEQINRIVDKRNFILDSLVKELESSTQYWTEFRDHKYQIVKKITDIFNDMSINKDLVTKEKSLSVIEIQTQCSLLSQKLSVLVSEFNININLILVDDNSNNINNSKEILIKSIESLNSIAEETKRYSIKYLVALENQMVHCDSVIGSQTAQKAEIELHYKMTTLAASKMEEREKLKSDYRACKRSIIEISKKIEVLELEDDNNEQSLLQSLQEQHQQLKQDEQRLLAKQQDINDSISTLIEKYSPELKFKLKQHDRISNKVKDTGLLNSQRKFSHYNIVKTLATHPHTVYVATFDSQLVVLKEFGIGDQVGKQMFERQVSLMKMMNHKCIMSIQAVFYDRNAYLQMEYIKGGNLSDWLKKAMIKPNQSQEGRKPWEIQKMFQLIVQGIAYMHSNGIIHRDIKLENILVREDDTPVISDFDLSKEILNSNVNATLFTGGTEMYLAPEMRESQVTGTYATDIWAFGVMLFKSHFPRSRDPFLMPGETVVNIPQHTDQRLVSLLSSILQRNPQLRPSAHQIAVHPYFVTSLVEDLLSSRTLIDSREKIAAFRAHISSLAALSEETNQSLVMQVRRSTLIVDVFQFFRKLESNKLFSLLEVDFQGEKGLDHGGLSSEMYSLFFNDSEILMNKHNASISQDGEDGGSSTIADGQDVGGSKVKSIFSKKYKLIERGSSESPFYLLSDKPLEMDDQNIWSFMKSEQLVYKTLGKIFLKAIIDGKPIPDAFPPSFFKYLLDIQPNLQDLEAYDPQLGQSFKKVLLLDNIDQYLSATFEGLVENGEEINVNDDNKEDFIQRNIDKILIGSRKYQLESFKSGFMSIESLNAHFALFSPTELQLLMCGNTMVDSELLKRHIKFVGFPLNSETPSHFLQVIDSMTQDELHRFLRFLTGMVVIPMQGLEKPLSIIHIPKSEKLPCAHTCSYQLDLPDYSDYDTLKKKILYSLEFIDAGFGFL